MMAYSYVAAAASSMSLESRKSYLAYVYACLDGSSAMQCSASSTWAAGRTMESTAVGATSMQLYNLARDLLGCPSGQVGHHN